MSGSVTAASGFTAVGAGVATVASIVAAADIGVVTAFGALAIGACGLVASSVILFAGSILGLYVVPATTGYNLNRKYPLARNLGIAFSTLAVLTAGCFTTYKVTPLLVPSAPPAVNATPKVSFNGTQLNASVQQSGLPPQSYANFRHSPA